MFFNNFTNFIIVNKNYSASCERAYKVHERRRPDIVDRIKNGDIVFVINTPGSHDAREDEVSIRAAAVSSNISYATDLSSARACAAAMLHAKNKETTVRTLQEYHAEAAAEYQN